MKLRPVRYFPAALAAMCLLWLLTSCGGEMCGGPSYPYYQTKYFLQCADTNERIVYFAYKDLPGSVVNTNNVEWKFSISRTLTEMYIRTSSGKSDTFIVRVDKRMEYIENECGKYVEVSISSPKVESHTFDSLVPVNKPAMYYSSGSLYPSDLYYMFK